MEVCKRFIVKGLVQGVFFRKYTQSQARGLGLSGWVKNLPGGEVEVCACGAHEKLSALEAWLWTGSPGAQVKSVEGHSMSLERFDDFNIVF